MANIDPRLLGVRRRGPNRSLRPADELDVVREYGEGRPLLEIQQDHKITKPTIYAILDRHNVPRTRNAITEKEEAPVPQENAGQ
jgi:hypothetical protein